MKKTLIESLIEIFIQEKRLLTRKELQEKVSRLNQKDLNFNLNVKRFMERIDHALQTHSSNSESFNKKRDIFYNENIGSGIWGLRNNHDANSKIPLKNNDVSIAEGERRIKEIKYYHRNINIIKKYKSKYLSSNHKCEFCGKNCVFENFNILEAHHLTPLSIYEINKKTETKIRDIAFICPNCHKLVHKLNKDEKKLNNMSKIQQKESIQIFLPLI